MSRPTVAARAALSAVLAAAMVALAFGARAGGVPAPDPVVHAPLASGGPTGRVALDGTWTVTSAGTTRRVKLPYSPNAAVVSGAAGERSFQGGVATYRTTIDVPADGDYAIRFESVNHRARVSLDGRRFATHTGAYLPFEARAHFAAGPHTLVVRADWRSPDAMTAQGWHRVWFNFGGIGREVTIRPLGPSEVDAPGIVTRLRPGGSAVVDVTARVTNHAAARTLQLQGRLGPRALRFPGVTLAAGRTATVRARLRIAKPSLWAPGHPALQTLQLAVAGDDVGGWRSRVGLRELRWAGGRPLLNRPPPRPPGASPAAGARGSACASCAGRAGACCSTAARWSCAARR